MRLDNYLVNITQKISGQAFYPYQAETARSLFSSLITGNMREYALLWARQKGKTTVGERVIKTGLMCFPELAKVKEIVDVYPNMAKYKDGFRVAFIGPTEYQAKIPFVRIKENISRFKPWLDDSGISLQACSNQCLYLGNGSMAEAHTAKTGSAKEGGTYHMIWKTEAQEITAYAQQKVFAPMLAATGGLAISDGTPGNKRTPFYNLIQKRKQQQSNHYIPISCYDYPDYPDTYQAWLAQYLEDLPGGKQNDAYRISCELQWLSDVGMLIDWDVFKSCYADGVDRRPLYQRGQIDREYQHRYFFGADRAKVNDQTVVTLIEQHLDHYRIIDWLEFPLNISYPDQNEAICQWLRAKQLPFLSGLCDSTGVGDSNTDYIVNGLSGYADVQGLSFNQQSKDAMYKTFNALVPASIQEDRPSKLYWPVCDRDDMESTNFEIQMLDCLHLKVGNYNTFKHPEKKGDTDLGIDPHDDYVDSLMLAIYAAEGIQQARLI